MLLIRSDYTILSVPEDATSRCRENLVLFYKYIFVDYSYFVKLLSKPEPDNVDAIIEQILGREAGVRHVKRRRKAKN